MVSSSEYAGGQIDARWVAQSTRRLLAALAEAGETGARDFELVEKACITDRTPAGIGRGIDELVSLAADRLAELMVTRTPKFGAHEVRFRITPQGRMVLALCQPAPSHP